jgi:hypothetical protein
MFEYQRVVQSISAVSTWIRETSGCVYRIPFFTEIARHLQGDRIAHGGLRTWGVHSGNRKWVVIILQSNYTHTYIYRISPFIRRFNIFKTTWASPKMWIPRNGNFNNREHGNAPGVSHTFQTNLLYSLESTFKEHIPNSTAFVLERRLLQQVQKPRGTVIAPVGVTTPVSKWCTSHCQAYMAWKDFNA